MIEHFDKIKKIKFKDDKKNPFKIYCSRLKMMRNQKRYFDSSNNSMC